MRANNREQRREDGPIKMGPDRRQKWDQRFPDQELERENHGGVRDFAERIRRELRPVTPEVEALVWKPALRADAGIPMRENLIKLRQDSSFGRLPIVEVPERCTCARSSAG